MGEVDSSGRRVNRLARSKVIALALAALALLVVAATALAATGEISQAPGPRGCISDTGAGNCADGHGLVSPAGVAVSPDRKNLYVASPDVNVDPPARDAVVRFNLNQGEISQPPGAAGCISESGAGPCADGRALVGASSVAVSPDGKSVYVASDYAVARFVRNPTTGALSQPAGESGCISDDIFAGSPEPCTDAHLISYHGQVTVSPDGKSVYRAGSGRRGAPQPKRDHRRTEPASRNGRLHRRRRVSGMREWSRPLYPERGGGEPGRQKRLHRLDIQRRRGAPEPKHDHGSDQPAARNGRLRGRRWRGAVRKRTCAQGCVLGGGQPRRKERLRRHPA